MNKVDAIWSIIIVGFRWSKRIFHRKDHEFQSVKFRRPENISKYYARTIVAYGVPAVAVSVLLMLLLATTQLESPYDDYDDEEKLEISS